MTRPRKRQRRTRCPFCQGLFRPDPRLGARQWACGAPACQRQRHAANCQAWRRRNRAVTRRHYRDYVRPARQAARAPGSAPRVSPAQVQVFLSGLLPEWRDAIITTGPARPGT